MENLPRIVGIFRSKGYDCSLTTNGFLLDAKLQNNLKESGLSRVNVSLHTLDGDEYAKCYNVPKAMLKNVLRNLASLSSTFSGCAKINFMAMDGRNIPSQLIAITELSSRLNLPVSYIAPVGQNDRKGLLSGRIIQYLSNCLGINHVRTVREGFRVKKLFHFINGGVWEIDDFRNDLYRSVAFDNTYCMSCGLASRCVEGPYALRVHYDGSIRLCLLRQDATVRFSNCRYQFKDEMREEFALGGEQHGWQVS